MLSTVILIYYLGYDIRDTCRSEKIGLDESVDMVLANDSESCPIKLLPPVMAVIGPLESSVSIQVANFFRIFQMPIVSMLHPQLH